MTKKKFLSGVILTILLFLLAGCSSKATMNDTNLEYQHLLAQIHKKDEQIKELQDEIADLNEEMQSFKELNMKYEGFEGKKRFVEKEIDILALPLGNASPLNGIGENTVVEINDRVFSDGESWYYVTIPVYDTPINVKGWIREKDTVPYTKDKQKLVQSDVYFKKGTPVYETDDISLIDSLQPTLTTIDRRGRLEEKSNGFAVIACPGGEYLVIEGKYLRYPQPE